MRIVHQMQCHPESSCPLIILLFKIIDHHTSGESSNWEEDDDCDELVRLQRAWHGSTWRTGLCLSCFFSSFLPASRINAINLCVVGDERVQPENLDHEKSVDRFSGSPSRRRPLVRPMGNHLTNERVSGGGEEPPKCPESLNNRRQIE